MHKTNLRKVGSLGKWLHWDLFLLSSFLLPCPFLMPTNTTVCFESWLPTYIIVYFGSEPLLVRSQENCLTFPPLNHILSTTFCIKKTTHPLSFYLSSCCWRGTPLPPPQDQQATQTRRGNIFNWLLSSPLHGFINQPEISFTLPFLRCKSSFCIFSI